MKKLLIISALLSVLCTGCSTIKGNKPESIASKIKPISYIATYEILRANPQYREGFNIALSELKEIERAEQIDFTTVLSIINRLPVNELKGERGVVYFTAGTMILSDITGTIPLDKLNDYRPIIGALISGIELGLKQ